MILIDTGPMVALFDANDEHHGVCTAALPKLRAPFLTVWPCIAEAMHILGDRGGNRARAPVWEAIGSGQILIEDLLLAELGRVQELMLKYEDVPMDLADACLAVIAERTGSRRIFTLDSDFFVYRVKDRHAFRVTPDLAAPGRSGR